jgi:TetR/AcrR family transcriptional repressor of bet genes
MVAWLTFWLEVRRNPRFARLQHTINRRYHSNMMFALRQLVPEPLAEDICLGLLALIDGFWWAHVSDAKRVAPARARRLCRDHLAMRLQAAAPASKYRVRRATKK